MTMTDTTTKPEPVKGGKTTIRMVCIGPCYVGKRKLGLAFRGVVAGGELVGDEVCFASKTFPGARAGEICTVRASGGIDDEHLQVYTATTKWHGRHPDAEQVLEWVAKANAFHNAHAANDTLRDERKRNILAESIEPLRRIYAKLPAPQQRGLETAILMALRIKTIPSPGIVKCPRCDGLGHVMGAES